MNDVIVVGAGPAGNNVAYRLASMGYVVTVVDGRESIGDKLCTGIVGRECIERFPLDEGSRPFRAARSAKVIFPGGDVADFARRDVQAYVVDRVAYVASFAEKARRAGAEYLLGYRATDVRVSGDCASVQIAGDGNRLTLQGRAVVLACGFGSELTRRVGLGKLKDYVAGVQAEVMAPEVDEIHVYLGRGIAPGFFAWLVPTEKGRALAGLLSRHQGQYHLEQLISRLQSQGKVSDIVKGPSRWCIPLRPLSKTYGERVLVVGDAAGQVKPTTGGGIYYALLAGEIAAETLGKALSRNDLSASQLSSYEKEWKALLGQELTIGYFARRIFESMKDNQIDFIVRTISGNGPCAELLGSRELYFDWHSGIIKKALGHPMLGRAFSAINPLVAAFTPRK